MLEKLESYQVERIKQIMSQKIKKHQTVFMGDSLIQEFDIETSFHTNKILNCGISGTTSSDWVHLLCSICDYYEPKTVVLLIGTNDLSNVNHVPIRDVVYNVYKIIEILNTKYEVETIYLISPLPVIEDETKEIFRSNAALIELGDEYMKLATTFDNVKFVNVYDALLHNQELNPKFTEDGLHLNKDGYNCLTQAMKRVFTV